MQLILEENSIQPSGAIISLTVTIKLSTNSLGQPTHSLLAQKSCRELSPTWVQHWPSRAPPEMTTHTQGCCSRMVRQRLLTDCSEPNLFSVYLFCVTLSQSSAIPETHMPRVSRQTVNNRAINYNQGPLQKVDITSRHLAEWCHCSCSCPFLASTLSGNQVSGCALLAHGRAEPQEKSYSSVSHREL